MEDNYFELKPLSFRANVAIVAPSSPFNRQHFNAGITELKYNKIKPIINKSIFEKKFYLAGDDESRANLIISSFENPEIEALWTARGGYGSLRLLEMLDKNIEKIKANPKLFIGFSDVTVIHNWLVEKCGFVTVHGPNITTMSTADKYSKNHIFSLLQCAEKSFTIFSKHLETVQPGKAQGVVKGGNLATLISLLGTPYEPDFNDAIVFLEDVGEVPYKVDRMITQLRLAGKFKNIRGVVLGEFSYKEFRPPATKNIYAKIIAGMMGLDASVPVVGKFPAGHGKQNMAILLGAIGQIDTERRTLSYSFD